MQTIYNTHPIAVRKHDDINDTSLVAQLLKAIAAPYRRMRNRHKIKKMLDLSPQLLEDIGLSYSDVAEALNTGDPAATLNTRRSARIAQQSPLN